MLYIALRSQYEVVTILKLTYRLNYFDEDSHNHLLNGIGEIGKLVQGLINSLKKEPSTNN